MIEDVEELAIDSELEPIAQSEPAREISVAPKELGASQRISPLRLQQRAEALRLLRMIQAGIIVSDYTALMVEIVKDNARLEAGEVYGTNGYGLSPPSRPDR